MITLAKGDDISGKCKSMQCSVLFTVHYIVNTIYVHTLLVCVVNTTVIYIVAVVSTPVNLYTITWLWPKVITL